MYVTGGYQNLAQILKLRSFLINHRILMQQCAREMLLKMLSFDMKKRVIRFTTLKHDFEKARCAPATGDIIL